MARDVTTKVWRTLAMPAALVFVFAFGLVDLAPLSRPVRPAEGDALAKTRLEAARRAGCLESFPLLLPPGRPSPPPKDCSDAFRDADIVVYWGDVITIGSPRHVLVLQRLPAQWPLEETWIAMALIPRDERDENTAYDFSWTACAPARWVARRLMRYAPRPGGPAPETVRAGAHLSDSSPDTMYVRAGTGTARRQQEVYSEEQLLGSPLWRRLGDCRWTRV
jgi:hypothetical protein